MERHSLGNDGSLGDRSLGGDIRRYATILFSDLSNSTSLGEDIDPEMLAIIVREIKRRTRNILTLHRGVATQFQGDGVLALFGYPDSGETDVLRALEAALEIHQTVSKLDFGTIDPGLQGVRVHIGIHSGLVVIGEGDQLDGAYELIGDTPNTAAGLCSVAGPGETVVSTSTLGNLAPYFETGPPVLLSLKGKKEPLLARSITARSTIRTRFEASLSRGLGRFLGREREIGRILELWRQSGEGHLRMVLLTGDPGIGKTRLLSELPKLSRFDHAVTLSGLVERQGSIAPLQPFLGLVRRFFNVGDSETVEDVVATVHYQLADINPAMVKWASSLIDIMAPGSGSATGAGSTVDHGQETVSTLAGWIADLARYSRVLVTLDDWQWADHASRNVLGAMLKRAENRPILVVLASREFDLSDPSRNSDAILDLAPFSLDQTRIVVSELMHRHQDLRLVENIHLRSGGNPLYLEELCRSILDLNPSFHSLTSIEDVPSTLHGLIEKRLDGLTSEQVELIRIVAVFGNDVPLPLLRRMIGNSGSDMALDLAEDGGILQPTGSEAALRFKHGLTRDAVYSKIPLARRLQLHLQIAELLESGSPDQFEQLAYHYAGGANFKKTVEYAEQAGDRALAVSSLDRAGQHFHTALLALRKLPESDELRRRWVSISIRWARPCVYGPERKQLDILNETIRHAEELGDLPGLASTHYWMGYINYVLGDQNESIRHFETALELCRRTTDERFAVQIEATLGQSHGAACNYDAALPYLNRSIESKRSAVSRSRVKVGTAYALSVKSLVLGDMGLFDQARVCGEESIALVGCSGHEIASSVLNNNGTLNLWQGRWNIAIDHSTRSKPIAERTGASYLLVAASAIGDYAEWMNSGNTDAVEALLGVSNWMENHEMLLYGSLFFGWISDALSTLGNDDTARHFGELGLRRAVQRDRCGEAMCCRSLARISGSGRLTGMKSPEDYFNMAFQSARFRKSLHEEAVTRWHWAEHLAAQGQPGKASDMLRPAIKAFRDMDMVWHRQQACKLAKTV